MKKDIFAKRKINRRILRAFFNVVQAVSLAVFIVMGTVYLVGIGQYGFGQSSIKSEIKSRVNSMTKIAGRYAALMQNKEALKKMNYVNKLSEMSRLKKKYFSDKNSNFMFLYDGYVGSIKYNMTKEVMNGYCVDMSEQTNRYIINDYGDFKFKFDGKKLYNDAIKYTYELGVSGGEYIPKYKNTIINKLKKLYPYDRISIKFQIYNGNLICRVLYDSVYAEDVCDRGEVKNDVEGAEVENDWKGTDFATYFGKNSEDIFIGEFREAVLLGCDGRSVNAYEIANGKFKIGSCSVYRKNRFYYVKATQYHVKTSDYTIEGNIRSQLKTGDSFYYIFWYKEHEHFISFMTYFSGILLIISSIFIAFFANAEQNKEGKVRRFYRMPADILVVVLIAAIVAGFSLFVSSEIDIEKIKSILKYGISNIIIGGLIAGTIAGIFITLFYTVFCAQVKAGILIDNMFITRVILSFAKIIKAVLSMVKLSVIVFGVYWVAGITEGVLAVVSGSEIAFLTVLISKILGTIIIARVIRDISKLHMGIEQMSTGGVDGKINTKGMMLPIKMEADSLNNISDGMKKAVESQMKSERMKTELITNVSHDIKTPVTAIISYVDLLKKEDLQNKTAAGYIDVLDRQSLRLKNLIYDLLDLSKSSTGNVEVNMEKLGIAVFIEQSLGEYISKFEKKNLMPIVNFRMDDEVKNELEINADGRHLSRVFDNIFQNINKYAMPDTRVYIDVELSEKEQDSETKILSDKVLITVKNMSETPLNLSGDELMERFVRGDKSRNTEGSGLGLSIAQNLMQLQNGNLEVFVDGDLFKVVVTLSRAAV